jgi:hypothetical protein
MIQIRFSSTSSSLFASLADILFLFSLFHNFNYEKKSRSQNLGIVEKSTGFEPQNGFCDYRRQGERSGGEHSLFDISDVIKD